MPRPSQRRGPANVPKRYGPGYRRPRPRPRRGSIESERRRSAGRTRGTRRTYGIRRGQEQLRGLARKTPPAPKRRGSIESERRRSAERSQRPTVQRHGRRGRDRTYTTENVYGLTFLRRGKRDPKRHATLDPVARDVRRLMSPRRSTREKYEALQNLQSIGVLRGGWRDKPPKDRRPRYVDIGKREPLVNVRGRAEGYQQRATLIGSGGRLLPGTIRNGRFYRDQSFGEAFDRTSSAAFKGAAGVVGDILGPLRELNRRGTARSSVGFGSAAANPISKVLRESGKKGLASSGGVIFETLDRPTGAVQAGVAKGLVDAGVITGKKAEKIRKARNPLEVLAKGRGRDDVSGGDLTEAAGLGRNLGLGVEVAADPLMWIGAGLAPATGGASLAPTVERIRRLAPEVLETKAAKRAFDAHKQHKNDAKLNRELTKLITKRVDTGERTRAGRKIKRTAIQQAHVERSRGIMRPGAENAVFLDTKIVKPKNWRRRKDKVITRRRVIPATIDAAELAVRSAEGRRVRPVPRLNLMTPTGRRTSKGVNLPIIPPQMRAFPTTKKRREELWKRAGRAEYEQIKIDTRGRLREIDQQIQSAKRRKDTARVEELQLTANAVKAAGKLTSDEVAQLGREVEGRRRFQSLDEIAERLNERHVATHFPRVQADEFARTTQSLFAAAIRDASKNLTGRQKEKKRKVERVQQYLIAKHENIGGEEVIKRAITLTKDEERFADELMKVYAAWREHGEKTGVLKRGLDDYVGMRVWANLHDPQAIAKEIGETLTGTASTTGFQRHRTVAAVTDLADPAALAGSLQRLSDEGVKLSKEDAMRMADDLFARGKYRAISELVARRLQRGEEVEWESLTELEKKAVDWSARAGFITDAGGNPLPMFKTPLTHEAETEGFVLPANFEEYGLTDALVSLPSSEQVLPRLLSLQKDMDQLRTLQSATPDDGLLEDIMAILARAENEYRAEAEPLRQATEQHIARLGSIDQRIEEARTAVPELKGKKLSYRMDDGWQSEGLILSKRKDGTVVWDPKLGLVTVMADGKGIAGGTLRTEKQQAKHAELEAGGSPARVSALEGERRQVKDEFEQQVGVPAGELDPQQILTFLDGNGVVWIRGPRSEAPIEGLPKRPLEEAGPLDDPFDYTGRIPDTRSDAGKMVNLDARETGYIRSQAQGITTGMQARWQAVDRVKGRSTSETSQMWEDPATGETGFLSDLIADRDENGQVTRFRERLDQDSLTEGVERRAWAPDELEFPEPGLLKVNEDVFLDPRTGDEYMSPRRTLPNALMIHNVGADRLWPKQAIDSLASEMVVAGELDRTADLEGVLDSVYNLGLNHGFQKVMAFTRFGVTTPFPAYHVRNLISDLIKSLQADTGVLFHPIANAKLAAAAFNKGGNLKINIPGMDNMRVEDFLFVADLFGVKSGHHIAEVSALMRTGKFAEGDIRQAARNSWFAPGGKSTTFGANREDMARYMTFLQRLRRNGGDAADAAWYMVRHHFNYNDLSRVERKVIRNIFLFYTWYRKNIPLQLMELARRPGFFSGIAHVYGSTEEGEAPWNVGPFAGAAPAQPALPEYIKNKNQAITTNWNDYALNVGFGAPWGDLQWLSLEGLQDTTTMLNPLAIVPVVGLNLRTDPLTQRRWREEEASGLADSVDMAMKLFGGSGLPKDEQGRAVLPWQLHVIGRNLPFVGRGSYSAGDLPTTVDQGRLQKFGRQFNWLHGLNVTVSPKPGSPREDLAIEKFLNARAFERRELLADLSSTPKKSKRYLKRVKEFDEETKRIAQERGIDKYLKKTKGSGFYKRKSRKKPPSPLGTPLEGGSALGSPLGGSLE